MDIVWDIVKTAWDLQLRLSHKIVGHDLFDSLIKRLAHATLSAFITPLIATALALGTGILVYLYAFRILTWLMDKMLGILNSTVKILVVGVSVVLTFFIVMKMITPYENIITSYVMRTTSAPPPLVVRRFCTSWMPEWLCH
jgi:hypothetical protein